MENIKQYKVNENSEAIFYYREATCRDKLNLYSDVLMQVGTQNLVIHTKLVDYFLKDIKVGEQSYNLDTLPLKYYDDVVAFANYLILELLPTPEQKEETIKKKDSM